MNDKDFNQVLDDAEAELTAEILNLRNRSGHRKSAYAIWHAQQNDLYKQLVENPRFEPLVVELLTPEFKEQNPELAGILEEVLEIVRRKYHA